MKALLFFDRGHLIDPFACTAADLTIWGMARSLARINRFSGNGNEFEHVSVAQHSVNLSWLVPEGLAKAALLHDVPEIFIGDIPSPIKDLCPDILKVEDEILRNIARIFRVPYSQFLEIKMHDVRIAKDEARFLFPDADPDLVAPARGIGIDVMTMDMERAADEWARRFYHLFMEETYGW